MRPRLSREIKTVEARAAEARKTEARKFEMRKILFIIPVAAMLLFAAGCNPAARIAVVEADEPVFNGIGSVHGKAVVESRAGKDLTVESATLVFRYKTRELATGRLMRPVEVPAGKTSPVRWDIAIEDGSLAELQTLVRRIEINPDKVLVDITARVRYGGIGRRVTMKDVPFSSLVLRNKASYESRNYPFYDFDRPGFPYFGIIS